MVQQLDSATINAILQKQGMPNTTENLNRIAQFHAVAPDMIDKYLGQGTDAAALASANGTNAAINNSIAQTDPRLAQLAGPNPLSATLDQQTGMTNIGPGLVNTPEPTGPVRVGNGAARPPGIPGDFNAPVGAPPFPGQGAPPSTGFNWEQLLIPILGPAAAAIVARARQQFGQNPAINRAPGEPAPTAAEQPQGRGRGAGAGGTAQPNTSRAPAPYSTDTRTPATNNPTRGSPAVPLADPDAVPRTGPPASGRTSTQTPADIARMEQETRAANEAAALQEQIKQREAQSKTKAQQSTRELLERGKRVFTGRPK